MKKLLLLVLITNVIFADISLKQAPSIEKREMPTHNLNSVFSFSSIIKKAKPSVVNIATKTKKLKKEINPFFNDPFFNQFFDFKNRMPKERVERSLGSGVIISDNGYIVTNNHVIKNADEIVVTLANDSEEYSAKLIGSDPRSDIAIIKIEKNNLTPLILADSDELQEADIVFALGNPFGVGQTVTQGIISALDRDGIGINEYEDFIQTDASINPGNSGGALIDSRGYLIGINTAILSRSGGNNGIGFAIPSNMVRSVAESLINTGSIKRGFLGITIGDLKKDLKEYYHQNEGAVVLSVQEDSAAKQAGLKRGDIIIKIDDKNIKNGSDLKNTIGTHSPNDTITLTVIRDDKTLTLNAKLKNNETKSTQIESIGLVVEEINSENKYKLRINDDIDGVVIKDIEPNSRAYNSSIKRGDVIVQIEHKNINSIDKLNKVLEDYKNKEKLRVYFYRHGQIYITIL